MNNSLERFLWRCAAASFFLAALLGLFAGGCATGQFTAVFHSALAAHLNALMGTFLLVCLIQSLPHLRYGEAGRRRLAWAFIIPTFANTLLTALKAVLHVPGLARTGDPTNDFIFTALIALVVLPTLGGAVAWLAGLF